MQNHEGLTPAEQELETSLSGLKPNVGVMDRDHFMFEAGRASARRGHRLWQGLALSLVAMLLISILIRPEPVIVEVPTTLVANNVETSTIPQLKQTSEERLEAFREYVQTRQAVLERGVEALTTPPVHRDSVKEAPMTRQSLEEFLSST